MRRAGFAGGFWPSPLQESLLRAALGDDEEAARAWTGLRPSLDLDDIWDPEVHRLLPLVHERLREAGVEDPDMPRLQGLARRTWYENQMRLRSVVPVIARLESAGIPTLLLKGMPLAFHYYASPALRPMRDADVLVPTARTEEAMLMLAADGWSADVRFLNRFHHGVALRQPDGREVDLHWHLGLPFMLDGPDDLSDEAFWQAASPFELGDVQTRMLCPSDQVLHVCVHGAWSASQASVRWVADAVTVIRRARDDIDWDRLVRIVERRRMALLVGEPLRYLAQVHGAPIPPSVLQAVRRMPTTRRERICRRWSTADLTLDDLGARALAHWGRTSGRWGRVRAARELPGFFRQAWGLDSAWLLPLEAVRKLIARLGRRTQEA